MRYKTYSHYSGEPPKGQARQAEKKTQNIHRENRENIKDNEMLVKTMEVIRRFFNLLFMEELLDQGLSENIRQKKSQARANHATYIGIQRTQPGPKEKTGNN